MMLSDSFMDDAYNMRLIAEYELLKSWQTSQHYLMYQKMLRDADSLFEASIILKHEGK